MAKNKMRAYTLPETSAVPKTMADEAKAISKATGGGVKSSAGDIKSGLAQEAKAVAKSVGRQAAGVLGKKGKKNWKRPGIRGIKGF